MFWAIQVSFINRVLKSRNWNFIILELIFKIFWSLFNFFDSFVNFIVLYVCFDLAYLSSFLHLFRLPYNCLRAPWPPHCHCDHPQTGAGASTGWPEWWPRRGPWRITVKFGWTRTPWDRWDRWGRGVIVMGGACRRDAIWPNGGLTGDPHGIVHRRSQKATFLAWPVKCWVGVAFIYFPRLPILCYYVTPPSHFRMNPFFSASDQFFSCNLTFFYLKFNLKIDFIFLFLSFSSLFVSAQSALSAAKSTCPNSQSAFTFSLAKPTKNQLNMFNYFLHQVCAN